jgi:REP-associated tyrosine transposase
LLEAIARTRQKYPFTLWAWVIMPEHVHLLLQPADSVRVASILQSIKQPVAQRVVRWAREQRHPMLKSMRASSHGAVCHRLWQPGGGYDRNLRSVRDVHEKIAYIHANPVRRGLVAHPRDWPWSSWTAWHEGEDGLLPVDRDSLPSLTR